MKTKLLLIEDDPELAAMLVEYLCAAEYQVDHAASASAGLGLARQHNYEVVLLDLTLPDGDGLDLCRELRSFSGVPVIMITARGDELDRIIGLELGADDYLPKPFNPRELVARIRAVLRRGNLDRLDPTALQDAVIDCGQLQIDPARRQVTLAGEVKPLTGHQFDLLLLLARNAGRVMSRDQLMNGLKGEQAEAFDRSIDVHIGRIRAAIEDDPKKPARIITVRGAGYLFSSRQTGPVN
ncbi:MAG: response regulator transcription factor [Gammaproteobacteria bacterium]|nr:response regulator transcription factor [Gammaproteobacteria bacterium]